MKPLPSSGYFPARQTQVKWLIRTINYVITTVMMPSGSRQGPSNVAGGEDGRASLIGAGVGLQGVL